MKKKMINISLTILPALFVIFLVRFYMLAHQSKNGKAQGLISGKLSQCPNRPNCVNSEFEEDQSHYIPPLSHPPEKSGEIMEIVKALIQEVGGVVQSEHDGYVSATFTVSIFGFVDDLEIRQDESKNIIHIRSASRLVSATWE